MTKAPTCKKKGTETRTCSICGETETRKIEATGHKFGAWVTIKQATDYENGKKERVCSVCGEKETARIPALKIPLTGDTHSVLFWAVVLVVAGGAAVLLLRSRKKKGEA